MPDGHGRADVVRPKPAGRDDQEYLIDVPPSVEPRRMVVRVSGARVESVRVAFIPPLCGASGDYRPAFASAPPA